MARCGAQEKTGHQLADLEPVWQYMAPGGPREIYYAYQILRYSGHQADDISGHTMGPALRREHPVISAWCTCGLAREPDARRVEA